MGFQILDSNNSPISINLLDKEAAELWGMAVDAKYYASPSDSDFVENWFDTIGSEIHNPEAWNQSSNKWDCVKIGLYTISFKFGALLPEEEFLKKYRSMVKYYKPFFDLIDHWAAKGYTAKRVED